MFKVEGLHIDEISKVIHQRNIDAGWWEGDRCIETCFQLISTELAEATEGERKDLMDDKLPNRKMGEVELADTLIRLFDLAGNLGWKFTDDSTNYELDNYNTIISRHWICNKILARLHTEYILNRFSNMDYTILVNTIIKTANDAGYNVWEALEEKLEYNLHRLDHTIEERAKANGKKV